MRSCVCMQVGDFYKPFSHTQNADLITQVGQTFLHFTFFLLPLAFEKVRQTCITVGVSPYISINQIVMTMSITNNT